MEPYYKDLREWIERARGWGEVVGIEGAHWDGEIGALSQLARKRRQGPALLFDRIPDYPAGHRILVNGLGSTRRLALTLGVGEVATDRELMGRWRERWKGVERIAPERVEWGPVLENRQRGSEVDVGRFPAPRWHEGDGGRYLGTGCVVVVRDAETGWVNLGTYRVQFHGAASVTCHMSGSHHGFMIRQSYLSRGEACPVAIVLGQDPLLFLAASALGVPPQRSEYDYAGGLKGAPIRVVHGEVTGLPIPAEAELVLEGFFHPQKSVPEGPFGEFTGYYAGGVREEPLVEVKAVYHRHDPIILGSPPTRPPNESTFVASILRSQSIVEELLAAGVAGVMGVHCDEVGGGRMLVAVALRQLYPGHARQVLRLTASCYTGISLGKIVVVVDEDVDITDREELMWAVSTRVDPERDVEVSGRFPGNPIDPAPDRERAFYSSRLLIDATRPYEWREKFAPPVQVERELTERVRRRWGHLLANGK